MKDTENTDTQAALVASGPYGPYIEPMRLMEFEGTSWPVGWYLEGHHDPANFAYWVGYAYDEDCPVEQVKQGWWRPDPDEDNHIDGNAPMVDASEEDAGAWPVTYAEYVR